MGLTECGHHVSAVYPAHGHSLAKTSVLRASFSYSGLDPLGSLKKAFRSARPDAVIPCDDRAAEHLHLLHAETAASGNRDIADVIERSLGNPAGYPITQSRSSLMSVAAEGGVRVPVTLAVSSAEDLNRLGGSEFPWVLKADGSWGGHGVRTVNDREQAMAAYRDLAQPLGTARFLKRHMVNRDPYWVQAWWRRTKPSIVAQAYIHGRPANIIATSWRGELLDTISAEVVQAQGNTGSATIVRIVNDAEMVRAARILASRLEITGFFGLDFMIEERTGHCYLIEMNPRCTPLSHLALGPGHDPLAAYASRLNGDAPRARPPLTQEDLIAYFPQAWHWDANSEFLNTSFCDVPQGEPELVKDLLLVPWPDRSLLARISNSLRRQRFQDRHARGGFFQGALAPRKEASEPNSEPNKVAAVPLIRP